MNNIAIRVDGLSKRYWIGARQTGYKTLRETLTDSFTAPFHRLRSMSQHSNAQATNADDSIWALKEVSFEVKRGDVVGIIGRNGAGKSTLLKILSRITEPSTGFAEIHGRVGSLLEVGTGFHSELSGRENIYLNGAILGMKKSEIVRKFDEIVAFAEVEKFIDTPIKHYSSGMYLRLAFAVAAYLEPEILIVDEVLAVGDVNFQRKCLDRMEVVGQQGRTVLLVSHNMSAITRMCGRAVLINEGKVVKDGQPTEVASIYLSSGLHTTATREWSDPTKAAGDKVGRLRAVRVRNEHGQIRDTVDIRRPLSIEIEYDVLESGHVLQPFIQFHTQDGIMAFETSDVDRYWRGRRRQEGRWVSVVYVPGNLLSEGILFASPGLITRDPVSLQFYVRDAVAFQVVDTLEGDSARGDWNGDFLGVVRPILKWSTEIQSDIVD